MTTTRCTTPAALTAALGAIDSAQKYELVKYSATEFDLITIDDPDPSTAITIANGASQSSAIDLTAFRHVGLIMPAAWTAAARLTVQVSSTLGGTYVQLYGGSGLVYIPNVDASVALSLDSIALAVAPFQFVKFTSADASNTPVAQGAARTITVISKE